jgi:hypothetical protein
MSRERPFAGHPFIRRFRSRARIDGPFCSMLAQAKNLLRDRKDSYSLADRPKLLGPSIGHKSNQAGRRKNATCAGETRIGGVGRCRQGVDLTALGLVGGHRGKAVP